MQVIIEYAQKTVDNPDDENCKSKISGKYSRNSNQTIKILN